MRSYVIPLITIALIVLSTPVNAYSSYGNEIPGDLNGLCIICHDDPNGGGPLNSYGADYAYYKSVGEIAGLDSDDDGFTNQQELEFATLPGDPSDYPEYNEPEGSPGFGIAALCAGILGALLLIKRRIR